MENGFDNKFYDGYLTDWWDLQCSDFTILHKCELSREVIKRLLIQHFFWFDLNLEPTVHSYENNTLLNNITCRK